MTTGAPGVPVDSPAPNPVSIGSLVASAAPQPDTDSHWVGGIRWRPKRCKTGQAQSVCSPSAHNIADSAALLEEIPYAIEDGIVCSTKGFNSLDYGDLAIEGLVRNTSRLIEQEFELGAVTIADSTGNFYLSDSPTDLASLLGDAGATSYKVVQGFGALERETMQLLGGGRCMIHCRLDVISYLAHFNLIRRSGNLLLTALDNIVVAGAGYTGADPSGVEDTTADTAWIYGTDIVTVYLDAPRVVQDGLAQSINTSVNEVEVRAQRMAATKVDRCANVAAKLNLSGSI